MHKNSEAQRAHAKAGKGAGGENPGCKWGEAGANQETCSTRFRTSCSQEITGMETPGTLLMRTRLKGLRMRKENSSPPNQNKATERWLKMDHNCKKAVTADRNWPKVSQISWFVL